MIQYTHVRVNYNDDNKYEYTNKQTKNKEKSKMQKCRRKWIVHCHVY